MKRIQKSLAFRFQLCQCSKKITVFADLSLKVMVLNGTTRASVRISVLISFRQSVRSKRERRLQKSNHKVQCALLFELTQTSSLKTPVFGFQRTFPNLKIRSRERPTPSQII